MGTFNFRNYLSFGFCLLMAVTGCGANHHPKTARPSPDTYEVNAPVKIALPRELEEVSGIAFAPGNDSILYAEQDEAGTLYWFHPALDNAPPQVQKIKFGSKGDYEDIAVTSGTVFMLRSDGTLFSFPAGEVKEGTIRNLQKYPGLLPPAEYEGMFFRKDQHALYVLTKTNHKEEKKGIGSVYKIQLDDRSLPADTATAIYFDVKAVNALLGEKPRTRFRPSGIAYNTTDNNWYLLSSVNKVLVLMNEKFEPVNAYLLDAQIYPQPEGIHFDSKGNLWLSSEGAGVQAGMVYFIRRKGATLYK